MDGGDSISTSTPNASVPEVHFASPDLEDPPSDDFAEFFNVAYGVILPLLVAMGILTNIFNIAVLSRPSIRGCTYRYLLWLALVDLLVCVSLFIPIFRMTYYKADLPFSLAFYQAYVELPLTNALISASVYIVVGLSIDRYVAVCHPQHYNSVTSLHFANIRIAVSIVLPLVLYLPHVFLYQTVTEGEDGKWKVVGNAEVNGTMGWKIWEVILELCHRLVPSFILVVLNLRIISTFSGLSSKRKKMTSNSESLKEKNGTSPKGASSLLAGSLKKIRDTLSRKESGSVKENGSVKGNGYSHEVLADSQTMVSVGPTTATTNHSVHPNHGSASKALGSKKKTQSDLRNTREQHERRLVILLLAIIVAFLTTNLPAAVLALMDYAGMENFLDNTTDYGFEVFRAVANCIEVLNFSLNFVLYFIFSREIRQGYVSLLAFLGARCRAVVHSTPTQSCYSSRSQEVKQEVMV